MENDKNIDRLSDAAPKIRECRFDARSGMRYDLMSDAILWEDEIPTPFSGDSRVIRLLLRYRTTVLLGNPDRELECYWLHGRSLFPEWPGFNPSRNTPSQELSEFLENAKAKRAKC